MDRGRAPGRVPRHPLIPATDPVCTVTFVPDARGGFILATNRDESPERGEARPPEVFDHGPGRVLAPRDADAGGTWVLATDGGVVLCILNGDGEPLGPLPDDLRSRGLLVMDLAVDPDPAVIADTLRRGWIERRLHTRPFKLLVAVPGGGAAGAVSPAGLLRFDWDGATLRERWLSGPQVAVSSTWMRVNVTAVREGAFAQLRPRLGVLTRAPGAAVLAAVEAFQASHAPGAPDGDAYSVCMHRDDARTVSSTTVIVEPARVRMRYRAGWPCRGAPAVELQLPRR